MANALYKFWTDDSAQDLVEYSLLIALVALGAVTMLKNQGSSLTAVWVTTNSTAHNALLAAS